MGGEGIRPSIYQADVRVKAGCLIIAFIYERKRKLARGGRAVMREESRD
jgi:hypothetical protein